MKATAKAHPNIALVKYWGKQNTDLNLPAVGSISLTLSGLSTISTVHFRDHLKSDSLILNREKASPEQTARVSRFLDIIRRQSGVSYKAKVISENDFPTGAGLASSASAFASLALAAGKAAGLDNSPARLSEIARLGSGSAARSVFGGFVEMKTGNRPDGSDAVAIQLQDENYWDIRLLIAITSEAEKNTGSTEGMLHTAKTSPYYGQWVFTSQADIEEMRRAIFTRNFRKLGEIAEHSCLKMHALAMSAQPGLIYWNSATVALIHEVRHMRHNGIPAYFTIDAGPQVKVICQPADVPVVRERLEKTPGVLRIIETAPGGSAQLLEADS